MRNKIYTILFMSLACAQAVASNSWVVTAPPSLEMYHPIMQGKEIEVSNPLKRGGYDAKKDLISLVASCTLAENGEESQSNSTSHRVGGHGSATYSLLLSVDSAVYEHIEKCYSCIINQASRVENFDQLDSGYIVLFFEAYTVMSRPLPPSLLNALEKINFDTLGANSIICMLRTYLKRKMLVPPSLLVSISKRPIKIRSVEDVESVYWSYQQMNLPVPQNLLRGAYDKIDEMVWQICACNKNSTKEAVNKAFKLAKEVHNIAKKHLSTNKNLVSSTLTSAVRIYLFWIKYTDGDKLPKYEHALAAIKDAVNFAVAPDVRKKALTIQGKCMKNLARSI